jgi:hypothetical protein
MKTVPSSRAVKQRGALLVDAVIGMFFFVLLSLSILSLFPVIKRGEQLSNEKSRAAQMCTRMLEHVQMLPAKDINYSNLVALNLIDPAQGAQPYSFTHVPMDEASQYSPAQTFRGADAKISYSVMADESVLVKVSIEYTSDSGHHEKVETGTVVGGFR